MTQETQILESWHLNADAWSQTIAEKAIESRVLVTNDAILDAIHSFQPANFLDLGCGEGWLLRAVSAASPGTRVFGLDAIPALVNHAAAQQAEAVVGAASYQDILSGYPSPLANGFDLIAFNFSLFGNELVEALLTHLGGWLAPGGKILIQTLHPYQAVGDHPYISQWLPGSWKGFSQAFQQPAPWFFRTFENWISLFTKTGYRLHELREPIHPHTQRPVSVIFVLSAA